MKASTIKSCAKKYQRKTQRFTNLHLEDVVVEEELQLFIREVDQKLLKAVDLEAFEAENVKNTYDIRLMTKRRK